MQQETSVSYVRSVPRLARAFFSLSFFFACSSYEPHGRPWLGSSFDLVQDRPGSRRLLTALGFARLGDEFLNGNTLDRSSSSSSSTWSACLRSRRGQCATNSASAKHTTCASAHEQAQHDNDSAQGRVRKDESRTETRLPGLAYGLKCRIACFCNRGAPERTRGRRASLISDLDSSAPATCASVQRK